MGKTILVVDDEKELLGLVTLHMKMAGFEVLQAQDGQKALEISKSQKPDLIILDLKLPELDGWKVCKLLREEASTKDMPVILLTALAETEDIIKGFDMGADDYVKKPFSPRELVARVKRVLSRSEEKIPAQRKYVMGDLSIDLESFSVTRKNRSVSMSETEREILTILSSHPGILITHEQLMDQVWGEDRIVEYSNISVHIRNLRKKIEEDPDHPKIIKTVKGLGYKFEEVESKLKTAFEAVSITKNNERSMK